MYKASSSRDAPFTKVVNRCVKASADQERARCVFSMLAQNKVPIESAEGGWGGGGGKNEQKGCSKKLSFHGVMVHVICCLLM